MVDTTNSLNELLEKIDKIAETITKEDLEEAIRKTDKEIEEENRPFEEVFSKIKEKAKDFATIDDFIDEYYNEPGYEFVHDINYIEPLKGEDEHRWYIIGNSIYSININGQDYYFGAAEVTSLKSESMSFEDTCWGTEVFKVRKVIKECWEAEE